MIETHIRPSETLRCESRPPRRELGLLRWSLAATIVLAAGLDALWLVPARESRRQQAVSAQRSETSYPEMQRRACRKAMLKRQIAAAQARVDMLEAEVKAIELAEIEATSIEVTLVEARR
jgi:hypothetical protein